MEFISFPIQKNDAEKRVDSICKKLLPDVPFSALMKEIRTKRIRVNRARTEPNATVREGDTLDISVFLRERIRPGIISGGGASGAVREDAFYSDADADAPPRQNQKKLQQKFPYAVLYDKNGLLIIDKPAGAKMFSPAGKAAGASVAGEIARRYAASASVSFTPAPCHRLDTGTSGALICAYSAAAAREAGELLSGGRIVKIYAALLSRKIAGAGSISGGRRAVLEHALVRDRVHKITRAFDPAEAAPFHHDDDASSSQHQESHSERRSGDFLGNATTYAYRIGSFAAGKNSSENRAESRSEAHLYALIIDGGKTHQLRAQCAAAYAPLLGDVKYGGGELRRGFAAQGNPGNSYGNSFGGPRFGKNRAAASEHFSQFYLHAAALHCTTLAADRRAASHEHDDERDEENATARRGGHDGLFPRFVLSPLPQSWSEAFFSPHALSCFAAWDSLMRRASVQFRSPVRDAKAVFDTLCERL